MKALFFEAPGAPEHVLRIGDFPMPEPIDGEVLIRVVASSINPADFIFIAGQYSVAPRFPQIAGMDAVGFVTKSTGRFKQGDLVAFRHPGAWAEYVAVPSGKLIFLPPDFPPEKGAQLILNPGTAWGLLEQANLSAGDWLLLNAGNSMVAKIASQIASKQRINVISIVRDASRAPGLEELGAAAVIDLATERGELDQKILRITGGKGVAAFFDAVGGPQTSALIKAMRVNGVLLVYGVLDEGTVSYHNASILYKRLRIEGFRIMTYFDQMPDPQATFQQIIEIVRPDAFQMDIHGKFALETFADAMQASQQGKVLFLP